MNKKDLKMYVSPVLEVVELEMSQILCASGTEVPDRDPVYSPRADYEEE